MSKIDIHRSPGRCPALRQSFWTWLWQDEQLVAEQRALSTWRARVAGQRRAPGALA